VHQFITTLRTSTQALLRLVREPWSLESWHWIRDTQLREDHHRYRGNGAGVMALTDGHKSESRCAGMNLSSLGGQGAMRAWGSHTKPIPRGFPRRAPC
jgi:hypothetical protein